MQSRVDTFGRIMLKIRGNISFLILSIGVTNCYPTAEWRRGASGKMHPTHICQCPRLAVNELALIYSHLYPSYCTEYVISISCFYILISVYQAWHWSTCFVWRRPPKSWQSDVQILLYPCNYWPVQNSWEAGDPGILARYGVLGRVEFGKGCMHYLRINLSCSGSHSMNDFSSVIQIRWKFHSALNLVVVKQLLWNFGHGMTAVLWWCV